MLLGANAGHLSRAGQARGGCHTWSSPPDLRRLKAACKYARPRSFAPRKQNKLEFASLVEGVVVSAGNPWESSVDEEEGLSEEELANLSQWEGASGRPQEGEEVNDAFAEEHPPQIDSPSGTRRCLDTRGGQP